MKKELTGRQRQLLEYIADHLRGHGFPPSIREMADTWAFARRTASMIT